MIDLVHRQTHVNAYIDSGVAADQEHTYILIDSHKVKIPLIRLRSRFNEHQVRGK